MKQNCYLTGIYARLSVDSKDGKMESIETQLEAARQYIRTRPELKLAACYTDAGESGTGFEREGFLRLMADVRQGKINCILVRDFSRFGRNYIETGNYIQKIFPCLGVRFISLADHYDSLRGERDTLGMNLKNLVNELYVRDISTKISSSRRIMWEGGSYTGGLPPYGYRIERKEERRCLLPDAPAAEIVRKIYDWYGEGKNRKQIARRLYEEGVHRPADYRRLGHVICEPEERLLEWSSGSLRTLLANPIYTGCMVRESSGEDMERRKIAKREGAERGKGAEDERQGRRQVIEGTHEALVTYKQFAGIQARLRQNTRPQSREDVRRSFPGDRIFCGTCGGRMAVAGGGGNVSGYFCRRSGRIDSLRCERAYLADRDLMNILRAGMRGEWYCNAVEEDSLSAGLDRIYERMRAEGRRQLAELSDRIAGKELYGSGLYRNYREGGMDREAFLAKREQNREALGRLREQKLRLEQRLELREEILAGQRQRINAWIRGEILTEQLRKMGEELIEEIRVFPDKRVEIIFRFLKPVLKHVENTGGNCHAP